MIEWQTLHAEMLAEIEKCLQAPVPEIEQVEAAFKIAAETWAQLRSLLPDHWFDNDDDEIDFYKRVKPAFIRYIEYYTMIYSAHILQPQQDIIAIRHFWEKEAKRLGRFTEKNAAFVAYYKDGDTRKDSQYFLPANYEMARIIVSKPWEADGDFLTSHDHLVAGLLAHEMYDRYVKAKLETLHRP